MTSQSSLLHHAHFLLYRDSRYRTHTPSISWTVTHCRDSPPPRTYPLHPTTFRRSGAPPRRLWHIQNNGRRIGVLHGWQICTRTTGIVTPCTAFATVTYRATSSSFEMSIVLTLCWGGTARLCPARPWDPGGCGGMLKCSQHYPVVEAADLIKLCKTNPKVIMIIIYHLT